MQGRAALLIQLENFVSRINDPRVRGRCLHSFFDIIVIAFSAMLCGAESYCDMENFGLSREEWLKEFLRLENGIPSHDTFRRVFSIVDAREFETSFLKFARSAYGERLRRLSLDGKSIAGAEPKMLNRPLQTVSIYSHDHGLVIGQDLALNAGFGEITPILRLLDYFQLKKALISVDAANSCPSVAQAIKEKKADYIMPLRDTNTQHKRAAKELFEECANEGIATSHEEKHGRIEDREAEILSASLMPEQFKNAYPSAKLVIKMTRTRQTEDRRVAVKETLAGGKFGYKANAAKTKVSVFTNFYISSRKMNADEALREIRDHWAIENKLHWQLDVAFKEDDWQVRDRAAARNLSILRKIAFNIVSRDTSKGSKRLKLKRAGWSIDFFEKVLFNPANFTQL